MRRRFPLSKLHAGIFLICIHTALADRDSLKQDHKIDSLGNQTTLDSLPLIEIPALGQGDARMAILYSGDGGWAGIDQDIALELSRLGIPTVGISSLRYFWKRRTQTEAAGDLTKIIRKYFAKWGKSQILLMGYSLGADVLPAITSHLPRELIDQVVLIGLMGPAKTYDLEFHLLEWIRINQDFPYPILPDLEKLRGKKILCFYGVEEAVSLSDGLDTTLARSIALPGGHHFRGSVPLIVHTLMDSTKPQ